ncbi:hypothetical protein BDQ12DRAFT_679443 [Crucibulum laeve]|uniref:Fe2OG dioxygenase domain-containing protein n=1 Tax=Crucibulum laeve TaxID=68775 RepID=A0A5C3M7Q4_9AGAR|nr:hypothetical protein BDQ12DRAFT_679443 [Crucibulum laeve]
MGHHHHLELPETPSPGYLLANRRTESTFEEIPVIDFKDANSKDPVIRRELADRIRDACINVGFFYLKNHGISHHFITDTIDAGKRFFSLPEPVKMELDIHKSSNYKGYTALLGENTNSEGQGDLHEGFDIGWEPQEASVEENAPIDNSPMNGGNVWPKDLPGFKEPVLAYYHAAVDLGKRLFPLFALALDLPENFFDDKTTKPAAIMRILHYPPQNLTDIAVNDKQIGIGAHTDYECFTILWQDQSGGLQVQNMKGQWIDAVPIAGTVVVNLGDQFARWTNDIFKSTLHRVMNRSGHERFSIPLFFGTDYNVRLEPIPSCASPGSLAKYDVVTAGDYVKSRLEATYSHSATN